MSERRRRVRQQRRRSLAEPLQRKGRLLGDGSGARRPCALIAERGQIPGVAQRRRDRVGVRVLVSDDIGYARLPWIVFIVALRPCHLAPIIPNPATSPRVTLAL